MRVLLTGIAGFVGSHLTNYLLGNEHGVPHGERRGERPAESVELHGVVHRHDRRIARWLGDPRLHLHRGDLRNALWTSELVEQVQPDVTLHLAAWSDVGGSWQQPWTTYELNIGCQLNLLESLRRWSPDCRTLVVTSNEVYGLIQPQDLPIDEATVFRPNSPYGVSKVSQDMMGLQYWQSHAMPIVRARSFNHIGPGQADNFAASAFARQIAEIEAGQRAPVVRVGNLSAQRDFTDVRDVVHAYWLLMRYGDAGAAYNVGSGQSWPVQHLLETLLDLSHADVAIETDPDRLRPSDVPRSVCDNTRLVAATGWQPRYTLRDTLRDLLAYWREQVRGNAVEPQAV